MFRQQIALAKDNILSDVSMRPGDESGPSLGQQKLGVRNVSFVTYKLKKPSIIKVTMATSLLIYSFLYGSSF